MQLIEGQPLFVGFKLDGSLRHQLDALTGPDRQYVSRQESSFLTICRKGDDQYVGKIVRDALSTDRVDDVRRNVLSIINRLCPEVRLPNALEIWVCKPEDPAQGGDPLELP